MLRRESIRTKAISSGTLNPVAGMTGFMFIFFILEDIKCKFNSLLTIKTE